MQPYYYMVYAIRRMLGSRGEVGDHGEWRAVAFFLLIQIQLLLTLIAVFAPDFFRQGTAIWWGIGVGIPVVIATYWILGHQERYSRYAVRFDSWSSRKRTMADIGAMMFGAASLFAPILARSLIG
jgi:hypothetical protein